MLTGVLIRIVLSLLTLWVIARWLTPQRFGKRGLLELFMINTLGDLAAHTVFHDGNPYVSGLGAMLLLAGLMGLNSLLAARYPPLHRLLHRRTHPLARKGRVVQRQLAGLHLTADELASELRKHGVTSLAETEEVSLESDGSISVIKPQEPVKQLRQLAERLTELVAHLEQGVEKR